MRFHDVTRVPGEWKRFRESLLRPSKRTRKKPVKTELYSLTLGSVPRFFSPSYYKPLLLLPTHSFQTGIYHKYQSFPPALPLTYYVSYKDDYYVNTAY